MKIAESIRETREILAGWRREGARLGLVTLSGQRIRGMVRIPAARRRDFHPGQRYELERPFPHSPDDADVLAELRERLATCAD